MLATGHGTEMIAMKRELDALASDAWEDLDGLETLAQLTHVGDPNMQGMAHSGESIIVKRQIALAAAGNKSYRAQRMAKLRAELEAEYGVIK